MNELTFDQMIGLMALDSGLSGSFREGLTKIYAGRNAAMSVGKMLNIPDSFMTTWIQTIMDREEKIVSKAAEKESNSHKED